MLFGERLARAEKYVALLADTGIAHGLVGPRERPRLWERHVLGCAVLGDVIPDSSRVLDIGSGAGLPGLVLAIRRPDLEITLVEPLHRRVVWLVDAVQSLQLVNVTVHEGRADSCWAGPKVDIVTARAVARIGLLAQWSLPLLDAGGHLLALKGSSAQIELDEDERLLRSSGALSWGVSQLGEGLLEPPATLVTVSIGQTPVAPPKRGAQGVGPRPGSGGRHRRGGKA
ncbi:MAG: 16S rRNA (guanine(527)-N(7))-methyltransferase RsmG [Actinomycetota bacterium]|nr:16S rRNA (guanine(527)-N(7))-methyltransferase RsmG [Actinomycetota bacterium]